MPEGDSYTRAARRVTPVLVGRRIERVEGSAPAVRRRSGRLVGATVETVRTNGKHLLIDLESGLTVHVHLGMAGKVRTAGANAAFHGDRGAIRLALATEAGQVWVTGAPEVEVGRREEVERSLEHLGPDLLAEEFDFDRFDRMARRYPKEAAVSDLLLDQRVMAGVGNEYKCEVLFLERLHPSRQVAALDAAGLRRLAERSRILLRANANRSVRSTTGVPDGSAWVYGRAGRPCRRCRTAIREAWIGDPPRITYWCPTCQPESEDDSGSRPTRRIH